MNKDGRLARLEESAGRLLADENCDVCRYGAPELTLSAEGRAACSNGRCPACGRELSIMVQIVPPRRPDAGVEGGTRKSSLRPASYPGDVYVALIEPD